MLRIGLLLLLLIVAAAGVAIALAFRHDISAAETRLAGHGSVVMETSFGKVAYAERGAGPPLLAIHGSGGGFDQGLDFAQHLADEFRLIAPSRFGYAGSDLPEHPTIEMQADVLDEFMEKMGLDQAFIFGGSAGALSAMELAIRHPERCRALVLAVPAAYAPTRAPNTAGVEGDFWFGVMRAVLSSDFLFWSLMKASPDTMTRLLLATDPALVAAAEPDEQARVRSILTNILPVSQRADGLIIDMATAGNPPAMALERIACPVLTLSLKDDMFGTSDPAEYIAAGVPNGRAIIYPTGGHVWVGHDEEIWREIRTFLRPLAGDALARADR
jgi:2-hydroxy-6-oxonona-2,4-dienedioate hydrolase